MNKGPSFQMANTNYDSEERQNHNQNVSKQVQTPRKYLAQFNIIIEQVVSGDWQETFKSEQTV